MADHGGSGQGLEVSVAGSRKLVRSGEGLMVGRADEADLQVAGDQVSRRHLLVRPTEQGWLLEDVSQNGCFVNGQRVKSLNLDRPVVVTLGSARNAPSVSIQPVLEQISPGPNGTSPETAAVRSARQGTLSAVHDVRGAMIRIGRAPDNDVVLDDLLVSRHHAVMTKVDVH